ncbi:hypothetical protein [Paenarthrobacter sp. NCHU4564]|uniref:hypothetical protein n=1 Tax=Paenarthrobacter sp. NCHU4564 TaxID=3451353 RepID=UPI003F9D542C
MPDPQNQGSAKLPPHRYRLNVPRADEAVVAWMELQDNQSLSMRTLIRESIERHGYVDIVNRPVVQLPVRAEVEGPSAPNAKPAEPPSPGPQEAPGGEVDVNELFTRLRR